MARAQAAWTLSSVILECIQRALVIAIEKATNKFVPIIPFAAGVGPDPFAISSSNIGAKNNYTYDSRTGPTTVEVNSRVIQIEVERSQIVVGLRPHIFA